MFFRLIKEKPIKLRTQYLQGVFLCLTLLPSYAYSQENKPTELEPLKAAFPLSPYTHVDDQGIAYGFLPSLVSTISERIGRDIDIQVMPYLRTLHALKTGQIDMGFGLLVAGSSVYPPENIVTASEPQLILPTSIYALPERNIQIKSLEQAAHYRLGTVRLESKAQRVRRTVQHNVYYYKDAYSLGKALQAHHIDLATLEPVSAQVVAQELGVTLERLYDYNHLEIFPVFSNTSPRIKDPLAFCQSFVETRVEVFKDGGFEKILKDIQMPYLLPYYNQAEILPGHCHLTTPKSVGRAIQKNTSR